MERAKENARGRGEAEAKRLLRDARAAADQVFAELSEMRRQQARMERNADENEARAALRRKLNEAEEAVTHRDARAEPIPKPSRPIRAGGFDSQEEYQKGILQMSLENFTFPVQGLHSVYSTK